MFELSSRVKKSTLALAPSLGVEMNSTGELFPPLLASVNSRLSLLPARVPSTFAQRETVRAGYWSIGSWSPGALTRARYCELVPVKRMALPQRPGTRLVLVRLTRFRS